MAASRPSNSLTKRKWAESAEKDDISEPTAERDRGYVRNETFPHDQANWLFRELFRWVNYFDAKFSNDKGVIDLLDAAGAFINETEEIDFTGAISGSIAEIIASASNATTKWTADVLKSKLRVVTDTVRPAGTDDWVTVDDPGGSTAKGGFFLSLLRAEDNVLEVYEDTSGPNDSSPTFADIAFHNVRPPGGKFSIYESGNLGQGDLRVERIEPPSGLLEIFDGLSGSAGDGEVQVGDIRAGANTPGAKAVRFRDSGGGTAGTLPAATNLPKAHVRIASQTISEHQNIAANNPATNGRWEFELEGLFGYPASLDDMWAEATLVSGSNSGKGFIEVEFVNVDATGDGNSNPGCIVRTWREDGTQEDRDFSLTIYYPEP